MKYKYFDNYQDLDDFFSDPNLSWGSYDYEVYLDPGVFNEVYEKRTNRIFTLPTHEYFYYCSANYIKLLKVRRGTKAHRGLLPRLI